MNLCGGQKLTKEMYRDMGKSRVRIIRTIRFGEVEEYSLQYQISEEFDASRTKKIINLCEHAIMESWCGHLNVNGMFTGHWLPSGKSTSVTFAGCPINIVRDTAELVRRIIDAEKVEEVTIDAREKNSIRTSQKNRQSMWLD